MAKPKHCSNITKRDQIVASRHTGSIKACSLLLSCSPFLVQNHRLLSLHYFASGVKIRNSTDMRLKVYWLHKLRAFKTRAFQKKNRSITTASDDNVNKGSAIQNTSIHVAQDGSYIRSSFIEASSFKETPSKHHKPSTRLSRVIASLGCGSTVALRLRRGRHKPKVFSEEEDRLQAPPLATFGGINLGFIKKGRNSRHFEDDYFGCLDPHAATKRWVGGACRCLQNVATGDKGSTRSDEALLSRKLRKELSRYDRQAKATASSSPENKLQNKGSTNKPLQNAFVKEPHPVAESKQMHFSKVEGSMSDRIVVEQRRVDMEAKVLTRWSSASVRDYMNLKGNLTPGDSMLERSIGFISSPKERLARNSYDERCRNASFERWWPQSITSVSTLSSYDFDRVSLWGSYDGVNGSFNQRKTGHIWQGDIMEESNAHHKKSHRSGFSTHDPDANVTVRTLSDCDDDEEKRGLLHRVSCARPWLNCNMYVDDDEDNDDDDDDGYADCFIDLEANAKAWATAWAISSSNPRRPNDSNYKGSSSVKCNYTNSAVNSTRSQRELDAAALKRKYHKEFGAKQKAIVVSSHHEDDMNTFMFPPMSDHDDMQKNPLKIFNYTTKSGLNTADQEGFMIDSKRVLSGRKGGSYHSLAVEKKSQNPYADFRDSMVDMVLEKQMYKSSELEELLQSFLCLNSLEHHDLIVRAFSEVWEKVFGTINGFH